MGETTHRVPRVVEVEFEHASEEVTIRGSPLMTDEGAIETARQVARRRLGGQPVGRFERGEVVGR